MCLVESNKPSKSAQSAFLEEEDGAGSNSGSLSKVQAYSLRSDTALRQEIGAAACCLRLPLYAAAFSPRPTCKVCFLKTFLWKIWIGCLVFETFVNDLLRALTVAQGRQSRRHQRKRPTTLSTGCGHAAPIRTLPVISQFFPSYRRTTIHLVQRHECSHLHIYHARILPGAQQGHPEPLFSEPPRGDLYLHTGKTVPAATET